MSILSTVALGAITAPFAAYYWPKSFVEDGFLYTKYPYSLDTTDKFTWGSFANPVLPKRGYIWTPYKKLKKSFKKSEKNRIFLDEFRFDQDFAQRSKMQRGFKKRAEQTQIYINPIDARQGLLLVGKMGAGKTEMFFSLLNQTFYNRAVIHQVKAGDFSEKELLSENDMLFSPYDTRGVVWDVMSENAGLITTFFEVYMNSVMGDKKDYFSSTSQRKYNELLQKVKVKYKDLDSPTRWKVLIRDIKNLFVEMDSGSQNSQKDVKGTMESIIEPLEIMAWRMQDENVQKFTIRDFFERKNQCKLILDNLPEYSKALTPLFTSFMACMSQVHMTLPDTTTDFTLYALDEYLTMLRFLDDDSKHRLHTLIRGKGGILIPGVQYIPTDDKKLADALTSSAFAWIFFSVIHEGSVDLLKKTIGETHYTYVETSVTTDGGKTKSKNHSNKDAHTCIISNDMINGLGEKYEHITYLPNHKMIYKGYTPQVDLLAVVEKTSPLDLTPFYEMKYATDEEVESKEELESLSFADLFKAKPLSKIDEFKLWKKFEKAKKEGKTPEDIAKDSNLVGVNLELAFKKFLKNEQVLDNKMRMFNVQERAEMAREWQELEKKGDDAAQLRFIEQNDLFGALPDFFYVSVADAGEL